MTAEKTEVVTCQQNWRGPCGGSMCGIYFFTFIGAAVYYIGQATSFTAGVIGFLKALVWPAFLIYQAFLALGR